MQLLQSEITSLWHAEKQKNRRMMSVASLLLLVTFLFSLCFRTAVPGFIPGQAYINLYNWIKLLLADLFGNPYALNRIEIQNSLPYFLETVARFKISVITMFSGMALALSGAVFQTVYHNPLASPNMIGATVGVNLGNLLMVNVYSAAALTMLSRRYIYCYLCTILIMGFIIFFGKFTGMKGYGYSVVEMVMIGSIVSHILSTFVTFRMYRMNIADMATYELLNMGIYVNTSTFSILLFIGLVLIGTVPLLLMKYRINGLGLEPAEAAAGGIRPFREQVLSQAFSIIIITAALIQCGDVGIFALVVPHIMRYIVGSDFRYVAIYSTFAGGIFLLICRSISSMLYVSSDGAPLNFVVAIIMLPVFIIIVIQQRKGFI